MKQPKRKVRRGNTPLIRLSLIAAATNAGVAPVTLKSRFGVHGIQPGEDGQYSVQDVVKALSRNGDDPKELSLQSHSRWEAGKARLAELEIDEREKVLVKREPVLAFMKGLAKVVYATVESFNLDREQTANICHAVQNAAEDFMRQSGAPLMTLAELAEAKKLWPHLETPAEFWARSVCEGKSQQVLR